MIKDNTYVLQTARSGSKSIKNKNILNINGLPLYLHNILYAKKSKYIKDIYISTDDSFILKNASKYNYNIVNRPKNLCQDDSSHLDTIRHGILEIERDIGGKVDTLIILLGNSLGAKTKDLDASIEILNKNDGLDSVTSVSRFDMFNPFRAHNIREDGCLNTFLPQESIKNMSKIININDRKSAGNIYFFNGSFWVCKRRAVFDDCGLSPFSWAGQNSYAYIQDTTMELDDLWQLNFIKKQKT